jgi:hypothetical protein
MNVYSQFNFIVDKKRVLNTVSSYCAISSSKEFDRMFQDLLDELFRLVNPVGIFSFSKKPKKYSFEVLESCSHIFFCIITIGDKVTKMVDELFDKDEYNKAIVLEVMSSTLLFEYTKQLHDKIFNKAKQLGMGLTCRVSPGDGEIPLEYQGDILDRIGDVKKYGIYLTNRYLIKPDKSLSFIYGSDKNIMPVIRDHDCLKCSNINCSMRER